MVKNVCVSVDLKYHQVCAAQEHTAAGDCLCVCEDAQLQDTQSETMFLHMLLTVSVHDMICVTSCSGRCHLRPCSTWAGFVSVPRLRVSLLSQDSHQICSPGAHTASNGPVTAQINLRPCKIFGFEPW